MKRNELIQHLCSHDCELLREGSRHSWWRNRISNKRTAVPRHNEISNVMASKICKDLGIAPMK
jgi:mRNA interferase HicA